MPEPRARVAICGEKRVKVMGRLAEPTDCSIQSVRRLISVKEMKGRAEMVGERPAAQRPGWVKTYQVTSIITFAVYPQDNGVPSRRLKAMNQT